MSQKENNRRIAKNTMFLYIRMFLTMLVSLYTSRIVLQSLGVTDFGIYNVVAGIVTLLSILSATLANSTQRFLSLHAGNKDSYDSQTTNIFSQFLLLHVIIAVLVLILSETIGKWYFFDKLNIPVDRLDAAFVVYQLSILLFVLNILKSPYDAALIVNENMKIYAYIGLIEVVGKLLVVYMLAVFKLDKLILYAYLTTLVSIIVILLTAWYVLKTYREYKYSYYWNTSLFKSILSFIGWNYLTAIGDVTRLQGLNLVLNIFFGPTVNAARGIAFQVQASLIRFVTGFQTSVNPQLVKHWSQNDKENMILLMSRSSKFSFFLLLIFSAPIIFLCDYILKIWLKTPPEFSSDFCRLVLIQSLIESMCYPMWTVIGAIGKLRVSHIAGSILYLLIVAISYWTLQLGGSPNSVFIISIIIMILVMLMLIFRINYLVKGFSFIMFKQILLKPILVFTPIMILFLLFDYIRPTITIFSFGYISLFVFLLSIFLIYSLGLEKSEKHASLKFIKSKLK